MVNKLIIYELNELPKKILDYYIRIKPYSNISKLKNNGLFWKDAKELEAIIINPNLKTYKNKFNKNLKIIATKDYSWKNVIKKYEDLFFKNKLSKP